MDCPVREIVEQWEEGEMNSSDAMIAIRDYKVSLYGDRNDPEYQKNK